MEELEEISRHNYDSVIGTYGKEKLNRGAYAEFLYTKWPTKLLLSTRSTQDGQDRNTGILWTILRPEEHDRHQGNESNRMLHWSLHGQSSSETETGTAEKSNIKKASYVKLFMLMIWKLFNVDDLLVWFCARGFALISIIIVGVYFFIRLDRPWFYNVYWLWIYENHICELRMKKGIWERSSQWWTPLKQ